MTLPAATAEASKLAAIVARFSEDAGQNYAARFAKQLFHEADTAELETYETADLADLAAEAFSIFRQRLPGELKVRLRERRVRKSEFIVADIVNDDMPFLLDSVIAALRETGLFPELVAHPVFEVQRDSEGNLTSLDPAHAKANGSPRESFIHLQIRKTGNEPGTAALEKTILRVLSDVKIAVSDFGAMNARLAAAIEQFEQNPPPATAETNEESLLFLRWLADKNFIFLGAREYAFSGDANSGDLSPKWETGLGLLRNTSMSILRRSNVEQRLTPQIRTFFLNSPPVIVAKGNDKSTVHRRSPMDIIGIKLYGAGGRITGQLRIAGLFTSSAYNLSSRNIPLLRHKVGKVLRISGHPAESYSERALVHVLETFPRDELFQISAEQLARISDEILKIDLTPRPRAFVRRDEFERFVSVFVYVPRERYNTDVRVSIVRMLEEAFDGRLESFTPFFSERAIVRLHIVIWRAGSDLRDVAEVDLEKSVEKITQTWADELRELLTRQYGNSGFALAAKYGHAFPAGYRETNTPERALEDIQRLEELGIGRRTDIDLYRDDAAKPRSVRATMQHLDEPLTLSKRVPVLENLGFNTVSERTFQLTPEMEGQPRIVYLHDCDLQLANGGSAELLSRRPLLEEGFLAIWSGAAANDRFNGLILNAGLDWRQAALLRAYAAYLRQTGALYGMDYVSEVLNKHAAIAADLFALFDAMFNPATGLDADGRDAEQARISGQILAHLDAIPVLDEDKILRNILAMVTATLRTNFYQRQEDGAVPETIAFKLRSSEIDWLPAPKPFAEIFVYSPRFEGIHLRGGPIARGGLRWSDRPQDFRTEVLSLAKAQQVKNVVIVPRGAKGGFVPRQLPRNDREAVQAEGIACYKSFISSLLSITDNLARGEIVPPRNTVRRDGDDPYLVVAADKGTATFSDIANDIALSRNFWLGDAFASGGSVGYDHKKMAITAKGAWEAVKRHFRELNIDIQKTPFTVAGVGDMSGDVFGNGMLLSTAIKLVAAFDHRDIFIDPDPDPVVSWAERKRLFDLPRSSWQDYDRNKLSTGGAIYSRAEKYIKLSKEARQLLGLEETVTPNELMSAIIKMSADLLWFGGIGTYVRANAETDAQAGDKANDAIRVAAPELKAKVIGEGANLGVTQRGRIEFALLGGKINTDAIDNSAGVNTSDVEVNIKIALGSAVAAGKLDIAERNKLLGAMTEEVAGSVLRNNYLQTLAISLSESDGLADIGFQQRLMQMLESQERLDRALENLPPDAAIADRVRAGEPLTRPELAVLLAYAKIGLEQDLIASTIPDDPYLGRALSAYFPPLMREQFADEIAHHRLRREIIATSLTNDIVNRGGPTFVVRLVEETGSTPEDIAYAFAAVMAVYGLNNIFAGIDALDGKIDGQKQLALYRKVRDLLRTQTAWFLRHGLSESSLEPEIARYRDGVEELMTNLRDALPSLARARLDEEERRLRDCGLPRELAHRLASLEPLLQALDIVRVSSAVNAPVASAANAIFAVRNAFHLDELAAASETLAASDYYDRLAVSSSFSTVAFAQRALARGILETPASSSRSSFETWWNGHQTPASRVAKGIAAILDGRSLTLAKLTVAVAQLRDFASA